MLWLFAALASAQEVDPFLWLEEVEGERALAWVRERNAESEAALAATPGFQALEERLRGIFGSENAIPTVTLRGKWLYNFWTDRAHVRGLWRRTTWKSYREASPEWDVVLDLDALGATEGKSWVWAGVTCLEPDEVRCMLELSDGGSDAAVQREFDTEAQAFVDGGFVVPESKNAVSWIDGDTLWVGAGTTESGYPREVRRWRRGTPLETAAIVFTGESTDVAVWAWHDAVKGFERDWIVRARTFFTNELYLLRDGKPEKIDKPDDADATAFRQWLYVSLRTPWLGHAAGSLLAIRLDDFLAGSRDVEAVFTPGPRTSLASFEPVRHGVAVALLDNVHSRIELWRPGKGMRPLPGLADLATIDVQAVDPERTDNLWVTTTGLLTPTTLALSKKAKAPTPLKSLPAQFSSEGLVVTQHEATSKDGTKVPYFEVASKNLALDASHPTLLHGYGGFEISEAPAYYPHVGAGWLEKGGVYVIANIRGGGEFGPAWHQAALRQNRHKSFEDFAAVAEDLVARKVTVPERLGIEGASNGGLLVGNLLVEWPQDFGAVVAMVPLLDMQRYHRLLAGASWMGEYGDPDSPDDWAFLQTYSPYHLVRADLETPPVLFLTSTKDDRVHPGHARKMTARMLEQGHEVLLYENIEGGHVGAADADQEAHLWALAFVFLWSELTTPEASGSSPL